MLDLLRYKFGERLSYYLRMTLIAALAIAVASVFAGMVYEFRCEVRKAESLLYVPRTLHE